jgi:glycosyltransferase involved in cell wall biosynthesis
MLDILVNVRSQDAPLTGVQRYIHEMCDHLKGRVRKVAPHRPLLGIAGHLWEQLILPGMLKNELLWSPANTGPFRVANQVVTIHDVAPLDHPEWFSAKFASWYRWLIPRLVKRVRRVITVSNFSKTRLLELTGVEEARIIVIPNGVNQRFFRRTAAEIDSVKRRLGVATSRYLLSLGSIEPRKNLARMLTAWSRCQALLTDDISLVVAGARGARHIHRNVVIADLPPRVCFTEAVPDEWLPALYSGATALIYPSIYEGFGLPVAEAMATGTVPIVSNCTALPEVVGNGGLMIDPFNIEELAYALVRICRDETLRSKLSDQSIQESSRFRWECAAQRVLSVLEQAAT